MTSNNREQFSYNEATFKLIIVGDSGIGKSCLLIRYINDYFADHYSVTVGVQFATKKIPIDQNYGVKLQIWDTAGQESFRSLVKGFYRNSAAAALVYDITKRTSFESLKNWVIQAKQNSPQNTMFVLIGTHLDQQNLRQVSRQQAQQFMNRQQIVMFFETSAKTSQNVNKAFQEIGKQLFMKYIKNKSTTIQKPEQNPAKIQLENSDQAFTKQGNGCC